VNDLAEVLRAFHSATQCEVMVVVLTADDRLGVVATSPSRSAAPDHDYRMITSGVREVVHRDGPIFIAPIAAPGKTWMVLGPCTAPGASPSIYLNFLLPVVGQYLQSALEVEHAANELAERYEEINLLYTMSEILGRTVNLEETARTILREISETVGARKGSILVHDRVTDTLQAIALLGNDTSAASPIGIADESSASATVFRTRRAMIVEPGDKICEAESPYRRGAMLSVPIMWTAPAGPEPLGVVNLSDRRSGHAFSAGDQKLITAIATQIGTAIQNARLVRSSIAQQRLVQEMELAHDLQMKLLPSVHVTRPDAIVAARVVPAESVGGDFYNLFRLGEGKAGALIGDVSSHGYRAALIMALAMSASAIHAQQTGDPAELVNRLHASLSDELSTTEMFITLCYAVVDARRGVLEYANTGHPHAFIISRDGDVQRLSALNPPLGMVDDTSLKSAMPWSPGDDTLLLFTDGISDARSPRDLKLGEDPVLETVRRFRHESPEGIVDRVFEVLGRHMGNSSPLDDLTLVVLRS